MTSRIAAKQLDYDDTQFEEGGTLDRQLLLKDGGVGAAKIGFSWKTVEIEASEFSYASPRSNTTLASAALSDTAIDEQPKLLRNGVGDLTKVVTTSAEGEWSLSGTTLSIHGDITASSDTYTIIYLVSGGGGGPAGDDITDVREIKATTTDNTPTVLTTDGVDPAASNMLTLDDDSTYAYDILVTARRTDVDGESAAYQILCCLDRNTGVATTGLVGTATVTVIAEDTAAWDVDVDADTTRGAIDLTVTGEDSKDIEWKASVRRVKVIE